MWDRYGIVAISLASLVPFFCLDLILWSHRFAGPMVRIRRSVHDLADGKAVPPIRLRANDYWTDLADDLNLVIQRIEKAERQASSFQVAILDNVEANHAALTPRSSVALDPAGK
jgi:hypothetical protein